MKVKELQDALSKMPPEAEVDYIWDGAARSTAEIVFLARSGTVMIAELSQPVYYDDDRPASAPTEEQQADWSPGEIR